MSAARCSAAPMMAAYTGGYDGRMMKPREMGGKLEGKKEHFGTCWEWNNVDIFINFMQAQHSSKHRK